MIPTWKVIFVAFAAAMIIIAWIAISVYALMWFVPQHEHPVLYLVCLGFLVWFNSIYVSDFVLEKMRGFVHAKEVD